MSVLIKKFGVSAAFGFVFGIAVAIWVSPTTHEGFGSIVVGGVFLTVIVVEFVRAVSGRQGGSKD